MIYVVLLSTTRHSATCCACCGLRLRVHSLTVVNMDGFPFAPGSEDDGGGQRACEA
jgi:hypothetical protein